MKNILQYFWFYFTFKNQIEKKTNWYVLQIFNYKL